MRVCNPRWHVFVVVFVVGPISSGREAHELRKTPSIHRRRAPVAVSHTDAPPRLAYKSLLSAIGVGSSGISANPSIARSPTQRAPPAPCECVAVSRSRWKMCAELREIKFPRPSQKGFRSPRALPLPRALWARRMVLAKEKLPEDARDPGAVVRFKRPVRTGRLP